MGDRFGDFGWLDAVIERESKIERQLCLIARDQCGKGDKAAVARGKTRPLLNAAEQRGFLVFLECRCDHLHVLRCSGSPRMCR
jgi:hypothetical protein